MDEVVSCSLSLLSVSSRVLRDVDFQSVKQTDRSSDKEGHGRPEHPDAGADGRSDRTLGGRSGKIQVVRTLLLRGVKAAFLRSSARVSDVRELRGERFGHVFGGSPADPVEERRAAVSPAQPGAF